MKVLCKFCGADFHSPTKDLECTSCGSSDEKDFIFSDDEQPIIPEPQMMYEVTYFDIHGEEKTKRVEQVTQSRLEKMIELSETKYKGKYFQELEGNKIGIQDTTWLETWYKKALENPWIAQAWDPKFSINSFAECKTFDYLVKMLEHGNWSTGTAFYYKDIAFINQVNGGDEWLLIRQGVNFESYSCGRVISRDLHDFAKDIWRYLNTPIEEINNYEYKIDIPDVIEFEGTKY